jgi:hypothetical protein
MSARSLAGSLVNSLGEPLTGGGDKVFIPDPEGLIAYYRFEDALSGSSVVEETGLGYTIPSTPSYVTSTTGISSNGAALDLPGVINSGIRLNTSSDSVAKQRLIWQDASVSLWFKVDAYAASSNASISAGYSMSTFANGSAFINLAVGTTNVIVQPFFSRGGVNINPTFAIISPSLGTWVHVVGVYSPTTDSFVRIYINGAMTSQESAAKVIGVRPPGSNINAGVFIWSSNPAAVGISVDELGIWNRALTSSQVSFLYNGGAGRAYSEITF